MWLIKKIGLVWPKNPKFLINFDVREAKCRLKIDFFLVTDEKNWPSNKRVGGITFCLLRHCYFHLEVYTRQWVMTDTSAFYNESMSWKCWCYKLVEGPQSWFGWHLDCCMSHRHSPDLFPRWIPLCTSSRLAFLINILFPTISSHHSL